MEKSSCKKTLINNAFYDDLKEEWFTADEHPVALLRAENALRSHWIAQEIKKHYSSPISILDVGCGAGFLANALAKEGHRVNGIDLSKTSLQMAHEYDTTKSVIYQYGNAYDLPFPDQTFDVVCAMDVLEHVEEPDRLISEASRVLKPQGLFFFHTFNRNWLSYLIVIKGVEWFVKNTPPHLHVYELFITPYELKTMCTHAHLQIEKNIGFAPNIFSKAFWQLLWTKKVPKDFSFIFTSNLLTGYCGYAKKEKTQRRRDAETQR